MSTDATDHADDDGPDESTDTPSDGFEVRSPYRPLTGRAKAALEGDADDYPDYDPEVLGELEPTDDLGRGNGLRVSECPPQDLLDDYELAVPATVVYESPGGTVAAVYPSGVVKIEGTESTISPAEAVEKARKRGFEVVETNGNPDRFLTDGGDA